MPLTLLLDLDNTLLENDIANFMPAYLAAFSDFTAGFLPPELFVTSLLEGTRRMMENRRPDCTLQEIFEETFYPLARIQASEFQPVADLFYEQVFPSLNDLTRPRPAAQTLVLQALQRGYDLVLATDPLFPRNVIEQRLGWAGLSASEIPFRWIPSYETTHFSKSSPAYFAELLARVGWPAGGIVMVGDNLERDILPARQLGLATFWITRNGLSTTFPGNSPHGAGELDEVLPWIESIPPADLQPNWGTPASVLACLRATPAILDSLCRDLPAHQWSYHTEADEWCLTEILCHLRDVDTQVNLPRMRKFIEEINPFVAGMDTDSWIVERQYHQQNGARALHDYTAARIELLDTLESLPEAAWARTARHAIFGPTSLIEMVNIIASHDRLHVQQVQQVLTQINANSPDTAQAS